MIGQTFLQYTITEKLGAGGMGVVYKASDGRLDREVALKFLPDELASDSAALQRFQREAKAASALNHPGICTIHSIEQHDSHHFIVMELLEGETLSDRMRHTPINLPELLRIAIHVADALESAHAKGIVHRDLKPANIFINDREQVKILDFGLAKIDLSRTAGDGSQMETAVRKDQLTQAGSTLGTVAYMSPEQTRGIPTDSRTDLFSFGTVLYQMATGVLPFQGETSAVVSEGILNRDPSPVSQLNPSLPGEIGRIIGKAMEKDRNFRYQTAMELKTDLMRLQRDIDSGGRRAVESSDASREPRQDQKSIAVLYLENLSGVKDDEYLRDGITEDIITELSKIKGLRIFSRPTVLTYRDRAVTPAQIGQQLGAAYVLTGSLRRAGARLRINAQLVDTHTDFPTWSERYDREMEDVFELQDEIARKIAEALRVTLSPQEEKALAAKPTENLQAYDQYLRGRSYMRRFTRQDLDFALQMFGNAVTLDPDFTLAHASIANACAQYYYHYERSRSWLERAIAATDTAKSLDEDAPEVMVAQGWIHYAESRHEEAVNVLRKAVERRPDIEGGYYILGRALFASGRNHEVLDMAETAIAHSGENYNVWVPIGNALGSLGKADQLRNFTQRRIQVFEEHLKKVPEDARARILLSTDYARSNRADDAAREATLAMTLRPGDAIVAYNAACTFGLIGRKQEALDAIKRAHQNGFTDPAWTRRDPDLELLHGDSEFDRLYPPVD